MFDAIADEVADIDLGGAKVGQNAAPVVDARTDKELIAGLGERNDLMLEAVGRSISPRQHDSVLGNLIQLIGMHQDDVAPHHHLFALFLLE